MWWFLFLVFMFIFCGGRPLRPIAMRPTLHARMKSKLLLKAYFYFDFF